MKEKKGLGEIGRREERREGRVKGRIVMVMMMVMMVMGCNSGGVGESKESVENKFLQSLVNVSNEFLNVFTSFGDMVGSVLGLNLESKKSDVGKYFKTVQDTVQGTKDKLEKIVVDMKEEKNPNAAGVESVVKKLVSETLEKIIAGSKTASEAVGVEGIDLLGNIAEPNNGAGSAAEEASLKFLIEGISKIVSVVLGNKGSADAGTDKKAEDGSSSRTNGNAADGEAGKLFVAANAGTAANAKKSATDATKAVGAVSGADILKAMIKDNGDAFKLAKETTGNANTPKDGTIAGAIALRAMAKGGKFANASDADAQGIIATAVKAAAVSAVTKALDTLTIAIRSTIDEGLKSVKEAMKINVNSTTVVSEKSGSGGQNK
ncbi:Variable outer membrane protein (plasmid) [Borrelia crocidurae DOU]|uniref:Variable large protein n=1 Tax=Borrelia crocidurae DOU TaxID=1293575 RepID=W5SM55_9SPIR|nr:variable large family protein [Borrelia crocidurae]AHH07753.1 Variable outer membrane protein [Borrelia crocidurae DOU]